MIVGFLGIGAYLVLWQRDKAGITLTPPQSEQTKKIEEAQSKLSIQNLSLRNYQSEIKIERKVRETNQFNSYVVSFDSDGLKQFALMNVPKNNKPKKGFPVVIVNHGYIPPEEFSVENSYINTSAYYASNGFLVLKPDYRGHDNSEGTAAGLVDRIGYSIDVLNLIAGVRNLTDADSSNVFMFGHSMGGEVSLRVGEVCGSCIRAISFWAPAVTSWPESSFYFSRRNDRARFERLQTEFRNNFSNDDIKTVSTWENINRLKVPVIIHHGTNDESVPYSWGVELDKKFVSEGVVSKLYTYENDNHDIASNWSRALNRDIEFFRGNIK